MIDRPVLFLLTLTMVISTPSVLAQAVGQEDVGTGPIKIFADPTFDSTGPRYSADGSRIAFTAQREGGADIAIMDAHGDGAEFLTNDGNSWHPTWSPDGSNIAFSALPEGETWWDIYVMSATGDMVRRVTNCPGNTSEPDWSPDGKNIVYTSSEGGDYNIWMVSAAGGEARRITENAKDEWSPRWSADNQWIFFVTNWSEAGDINIWKVPSAGGEPTQVTFGPADEVTPAPSPDGRWLAYYTDVGGLWVINLETGESENIAPGTFADILSWSPDGKYIVASLVPHPSLLREVSVEGGASRTIDTGDWSVWGTPSFSPDGTQIVFAQLDTATADVWTSNLEGFEPSQVTSHLAADLMPAWSPDGDWIAFSSQRDSAHQADIWKTDLSGNQMNRLTSLRSARVPRWCDEGRAIVFHSDRSDDGRKHVWLVSADGGDARQLTTGAEQLHPDCWKDYLVYVEMTGSTSEVFVASLSGNQVRKITNESSHASRPQWAPDGSKIAYVSDRDGAEEIYVIGANGGKSIRLTSDGGSKSGAEWTPDGESILYNVQFSQHEIWRFEADSQVATAQEPATVPKHYKVDAAEAPTKSLTPDGRFRLYTEEAGGGDEQLFLRDLTTGESRRLTAGPGTASEAILSPDGTLIAYTWVNPAYGWATEDRLIELQIVGIDGSGPRALYSNSDVFASSGARLARQFNPPLRIHEWSSDGKYVAAALYQEHQAQLVLFSVEDNSVRVLRTQPLETLSYSSYFTKLRFSPDGRFVVYDPTPGRDSPRDIFVIPAEGGSEVPLVQHQDNDILLDWTPDGRGVLFASDRSGRWDLWLIQVLDGGPRGIAQMVYPNIGPFSSGLGFNRDGSYYYGVTVWENDVYVATLDPASYRLGGPTKLVSHVGYRTSTQWSRDGKYLAYAWGNASASGVGSESDPFVLGIRSLETGQESRLRLGELLRHGGHGFDPQWSSDGHFIIVDARERDYLQGQGLYRIDVQTGTVTPAVRTDVNRGYNRIESPAWSSDGRVIFERRPPQRIMTRDLQTGEERELYRPVPPAQIHHWPTSNLAISPDGQRLAFVWSDGKTVERIFALMVLPTAGGEPRELLRTQDPARIGVPAWTPDSRQIIYARSVTGEEGMFEFWRISAEGGEPRNLGLKMEARVPYGLSVHPDGTRIAFTAGTERRSEIRVLDNFLPAVNPDRSVSGTSEEYGPISLAAPARGQHGSNSRATRTAASPEFEFQAEDHIQNVARLQEGRVVNVQPLRHLTWSHGYDPSVSPDGRLVAFATSIRDKAQMWTTPFEASDTRWQPLTPVDFPHDSAHPTWSPDGRAIAFFVSGKGIWLMSASGEDLRQVTHNTVRDGYPRWFPDGRRLAFTRIVGADRVEDIWMIDLDSRMEYQLTTNPADEGASTISPDGRYLSFSSDRGGQTDLWILPMAEGEAAIRQFTNDGGRGPAWSPDGHWITYGCPVAPSGYALCLKAVSGGPVIQVTDGSANDFNPSWSPDGNSVVVSQNSGLAVVDVSAIVR